MAKESKNFLGIMVSSTFTDLEKHRAQIIKVIDDLGFKAVVMEHSGASPADLITASLNMVADCAAYILLISHKYGQTPKAEANPDTLSITELEFNEAVKLRRPRLLFVMSEDHPTTKAQIETDTAKQKKLEAFKRRAKLAEPDNTDSDLTAVYQEFSSVEDLKAKAAVAIARLTANLPQEARPSADGKATANPVLPPIARPSPPALRAVPSYGGSHSFVGRRAELEVLDDWASPNDPHPILLFEAIGGSGKSMLTWHWIESADHATAGNWAGRFWYSFYEAGATLGEFCREALSYLTGLDAEAFRKMRGPALAEHLIARLESGRCLLVLDGIERILVGYQRLDAPQMRDEEANTVTDPILDRDPCRCIQPEDDDLLRRLAQVSNSKLLVSSRLLPAAFINSGGTAIPGVRRELLKGLRPPDALALFRDCGVEGPSQDIEAFLQAHCDGHPLTVGALAGLVNAYPRDHGNFVRWRDDPHHGGALSLADCDLVQKRNHILDAAIAALAPKARELLQGLAILRGGADYDLLLAINPFLPIEPKEVEEPRPPEQAWGSIWVHRDAAWQQERLHEYDRARGTYRAYLVELEAWQADPAVEAAPRELNRALADLERRGLLQFDKPTRRYDLHPVVRGVASGRMNYEDIQVSGSRVVDYCQARNPEHWDDARTPTDVELGIQTVSALIQMHRFDRAFDVFSGSLFNAMFFNLELDDQLLSILRDFFPNGMDEMPNLPSISSKIFAMNSAAVVLEGHNSKLSRKLHENVIKISMNEGNYYALALYISNLASMSNLSVRKRLTDIGLDFSNAFGDSNSIFVSTRINAWLALHLADYNRAKRLIKDLFEFEPPTYRGWHRAGDLELLSAEYEYYRGTLTESKLTAAEEIARGGINRASQRALTTLRGRWLLDRSEPEAACAPLQRAITMARDVGLEDRDAEAALALARLRCGDKNPPIDSERWDTFKHTAALYLAWFWHERGDRNRALAAALRAFQSAHDPGEPYVYRWEADRARDLLLALGETPPEIPPYDPASDPPFPWEADIRALIAKLEAEAKKKRDDDAETDDSE